MKKLIKTAAALVALLIAAMSITAAYAENGVVGMDPQTGEYDIWVSPDGDDANDGASAGTALRTVAAAKEAAGRSGAPEGVPLTVWFAEGEYELGDTLEFGESDRPGVTYAAQAGAKVSFTGAHPVTGFETGTVNGVRVFIKKLGAASPISGAKSLFDSDGRLYTPRYPEEGYLHVDKTDPENDLFTEDDTPWDFCLGQQSFIAKDGDIPDEVFAQGTPTVRIFHYWHDEMMFATYESPSRRVMLSRPSTMRIREEDRYCFENVFSELKKPGQWYLDGDTLYYVPKDGETPEGTTLYASGLQRLLTIDGASDIAFRGIVFKNSDWEIAVSEEDDFYARYGMDSSQAAVNVKGAVTVKNASGVRFENCEFRDLGGTGVKILEGVRDSSVESCLFDGIAATGVFIGGKNVGFEGGEGLTSDIRVVNNIIRNYGRIFYNAIGVQLTFAADCDIEHNEIHDGYYSAMSIGWQWDYPQYTTHDIRVKDNLIYDIGQGWLADMGGIYTLGKQPGTVLSGNVIHDVACDPGQGGYGGWGIYLDEGSSYMTVEKNLVFSCSTQGFNIHYGEGNIIRNNISALNGDGQVSVGTRNESHATAFYCDNIWLTDSKSPVYVYMHEPDHFAENGNLMWDLSNGDDLYFTIGGPDSDALSLAEAKLRGFLRNAKAADPLFKDAANFDFEIDENSPVFSGTYFNAWDYQNAGTLAGTLVGYDTEGGGTPYNAGAAKRELTPVTTGKRIARFAAVVAGALLFVAAAVLSGKKTEGKKRKLAVIAVVAMLVLCVPTYYFFVRWTPVLYGVCVGLMVLLSGVPSALMARAHRLRAYLVPCAVCLALIEAVTLTLNNLLRVGEPTAITAALCAVGLLELILAVSRRKSDGKGNT